MPFRNVDDLIEQIESWLEAPDLKSEIPDFLRLAEIYVAREIGWRFTHTKTTGTISAGTALTLPTDCLWADSLEIDTDSGPVPVNIVGAKEFIRQKRVMTSSETPSVARHVGLTMEFAPAGAVDYPYTLYYWKLIVPLDDTTATNWILVNGPDCLLWRSCELGALFREQVDRAMTFKAYFEPALTSLKRLEWRARTGGGNLAVTTDYERAPSPKRI